MYRIIADNKEINATNLSEWLVEYKNLILPKRKLLGDYYDGKNEIIKQNAVQGRPNYSINVNMAKYITDVATGYTFGKPLTYSISKEEGKKALENLALVNSENYAEELDYHIGGDMSAYGVGYQLVYPDKNSKTGVKYKRLEPLRTFMVTDNSIEENVFCAIYFHDYIENKQCKTRVYLWDEENVYTFDGFSNSFSLSTKTKHLMGQIPVIESLNNDDAFGDFQMVLDLLDSLNLMISNNTDDLQSVSNAILAVNGGKLGEEEIKQINKYKVANLPTGANMQWVIKNTNTEGVLGQIKYLLNFIFQISMVPDLSDDAFAGNLSGVAMQFKMWGIDQLWTSKIRKYKTSINKRIKMTLRILGINEALANDIQVNFYRNLPENMAQDYEIAKNLSGVISLKTLLKNLSIVQDAEEEYKLIKEEKQNNQPDQPNPQTP
ncbi:TPA: phage portal protein [Candidatus Galligastranaerophilus intestinigallinarum]|nr:phage portal protein [Candidatus Galligastranaerophilus intestinigallinarum]